MYLQTSTVNFKLKRRSDVLISRQRDGLMSTGVVSPNVVVAVDTIRSLFERDNNIDNV